MLALRVLPLKKTNLATLFAARQVRTWLVKRATSVFNSFCSNFAKPVARFLLPVLLKLNVVQVPFYISSNAIHFFDVAVAAQLS